jgi:hypothetical protein
MKISELFEDAKPDLRAFDNAGYSDHEGMSAEYSEWYSSLNLDEKYAISSYTGSAHRRINSALMSGKTDLSDNDKKIVKSLDDALARGKLPKTTIVYRGVRQYDLAANKTFVSTSISKKVALKFATDYDAKGFLMEITVPKGSSGAYIEGNSTDMELLLPRQTKFSETGRAEENGVTVISVTADTKGKIPPLE